MPRWPKCFRTLATVSIAEIRSARNRSVMMTGFCVQTWARRKSPTSRACTRAMRWRPPPGELGAGDAGVLSGRAALTVEPVPVVADEVEHGSAGRTVGTFHRHRVAALQRLHLTRAELGRAVDSRLDPLVLGL